jgi:hypothetical protein
MQTTYYLISLFLLFSLVSAHEIREINYYAYYYTDKEMIICSDKEYSTNQVILNEFKTDEGFTCLLNLKRDGYYILKLFLRKLGNSNKKRFSTINISLGKETIEKQLTLDSDINTPSKIELLMHLSKGNAFFIPFSQCKDLNLIKCNFKLLRESVMMNKYIQLNFLIEHPNTQKDTEITLLQKSGIIEILN